MSNESNFSDTVIMLKREGMGCDYSILQRDLLDKYLKLLLEKQTLPAAIIFYTEAVRLTVKGSKYLDTLSQLQQKGVRLMVCAASVEYFGLKDKILVGTLASMADILEAQSKADKLIAL
jgi:intracellular sulfur oxidation DsrE/DsrF family protein